MTSCITVTCSLKKELLLPNSNSSVFHIPSEIDIKCSGLIPLKLSQFPPGSFHSHSHIFNLRPFKNLSFYLYHVNSSNFAKRKLLNSTSASSNNSENISSENSIEINSIENHDLNSNPLLLNSSSNSTSSDALELPNDEKQNLSSKEDMVFSIRIASISLSLVLAIISISAAFSMAATAEVAEKTTKKKASTKRTPKTMAIEERQEWSKDLPVVNKKLPYTDILELQRKKKLKYIVKHPLTVIRSRPDSVLLVLDNDEVVRTILPPPQRDPSFWMQWEEEKLNDNVIDAYTPSISSPTILPWGTWGPTLTWLDEVSKFLQSVSTAIERRERKVDAKVVQPPLKSTVKKKEKKGKVSGKKKGKSSVQERIEELERAKREVELGRIEREKRLVKEKEERVKREKEERIRAQRQAKEDAKRKIREGKLAVEEKERVKELAKKENKIITKYEEQEKWNDFFRTAATNEMVRFGMGIGFFFLFYYGIVLNIKKRRKDYEDRMKILQAEEEERRKMREWEDNMTQAEIIVSAEQAGMSQEEKEKLKEQEEVNPQLQMSRRFLKSGASIRAGRGMRKRKLPQYMEMDVDVKFSDVAGLGEIRTELEEVVDFFTNAEKYRRRGSKIPSGILLCGGPGTGKTLLAKAVAGEAGVNFFSISASQFVQIYVGVGASRVRALYQEAKENAPAVVFIDELDAVGRRRGLTPGSGGQERDATLNQLLTCLDGFENKGEVITIAATNRVDILDPALIRPGRFDRKIFIPLPSFKGRQEIIKVHARDKPMSEDVDYESVAGVAEGMAGAQLANIVDIATLRVLREGRSQVETEDLMDAIQIERGGSLNPHIVSEEREKQLAINESALAVVAYNFPELRNLSLMTVRPRMNDEKGVTFFKGDLSKYKIQAHGLQRLLNIITVNMSPRIADEMINGFDNISTIWADSSDTARHLARSLVLHGMSDNPDLRVTYDAIKDKDRVESVDVEAEKILNKCRAKAHDLLIRNRKFMDALIDQLVKDKTIRGPKIAELAAMHGDFDSPPLDPVEIREKNSIEFRESMIRSKRNPRESSADVASDDENGGIDSADVESEKIYVENKQ